MFEARNAAVDAILKFNRNRKPEGSCFEELFYCLGMFVSDKGSALIVWNLKEMLKRFFYFLYITRVLIHLSGIQQYSLKPVALNFSLNKQSFFFKRPQIYKCDITWNAISTLISKYEVKIKSKVQKACLQIMVWK